MRRIRQLICLGKVLVAVLLILSGTADAQTTDPPATPVKLIFIHHSCGGNWLADETPDIPSGGLGAALMNNNYYVSATNYDWGPDGIGTRTDIPNWPEWFTGPNSGTILAALYTETGQTLYSPGDWRYFGPWSRMATDPGGENEIILFKSCFPNSDLYGNPDDPPLSSPNDQYTVANAKAVYNDLLTYFRTRTDKLFVAITAPPLIESETTSDRAANARAFNNWLVNDWLQGYSHNNVAVFDYFNVLTGPDNHHRVVGGQVTHVTGSGSDFAYYPSGDSHPSSTGHRKATSEFVPLLNYYYNRWTSGGTAVVTGNIDGSADGEVTLADAIVAVQVCAGMAPSGVVADAEVNGDDQVGLAEAIFALQTVAGAAGSSGDRVQPGDLTYLGAFRLPDDFNWGARGMSYYPDGAGGEGSLLITASEALRTPDGEACYEGLDDCAAYFAEVAIPDPAQEAEWTALPVASFLTEPTTFDDGLVQTVHPAHAFVTGIQYMPRQGSQVSDKMYGSLNEWYPGGYGDKSFPTVWLSNLDGTDARGVFHVGPETDPLYHGRKMGDFLFTVPAWYADAYLGGRILVTGRSRGTPVGSDSVTTAGGSQGPTLFAFMPLTSDNPSAETELDALPLLYYRVKYPGCAGPDIGVGGAPVDCDYPNFSMCDSWDGGSFIGTQEKNAIVLLGHKGTTNCYYCDETGDDPECDVEPPIPECARYCNESRGYHCGPYYRQIIFYDSNQLASAAQGTVSPWEVLPYEIWEPPDFFLTGDNVCGGVGGMTYDDATRRLFVTERGLGGYRGENAAVVHVWQVN